MVDGSNDMNIYSHIHCSVDGCGSPIKARGWCNAHYRRWRRHGDPVSGGTMGGEPHRFLHDVAIPFIGDECLFWPYATNGHGRGQIKINGRSQLTHRIICESINGPPPSPKYEAAHYCGHGHLGCCNPRHLRWATRAENEADKLIHGTHNRGERQGSAKLTEAQILMIRELGSSLLQREIAAKFGVSREQVGNIIRRKNWAHV